MKSEEGKESLATDLSFSIRWERKWEGKLTLWHTVGYCDWLLCFTVEQIVNRFLMSATSNAGVKKAVA